MTQRGNSWGHVIWTLTDDERVGRVLDGRAEAVRAFIGSVNPTDVPPPELRTCSNGLRCPGKRTQRYDFTGPGGQIEYSDAGKYHTVVGAPAIYGAGYSYVTGRGGRVSRCEKVYCEACATKWRAKHSTAKEIIGTVLGLSVVVDPTMLAGEVHFRQDGKTVAKIIDVEET